MRHLLALTLAGALCSKGTASPWPPSARQRAEALVARMTLDDLANQTAALQMAPYQGTIPAMPQYGIPHIGDEDGPQGVAGGLDNVTSFPSAMTIAQCE
jgi:hypothetical protein